MITTARLNFRVIKKFITDSGMRLSEFDKKHRTIGFKQIETVVGSRCGLSGNFRGVPLTLHAPNERVLLDWHWNGFFKQLTRNIHCSCVLDADDYYRALGVARDASAEDIKKAYYELAKKHHPDASSNDPDSSEKFREISEAYEVLGDKLRRWNYDFSGASRNGLEQQSSAKENPSRNASSEERTFEMAFEDQSFPLNRFTEYADSGLGADTSQHYVLDVSFMEAAQGVKKDVILYVPDTCPRCQGHKYDPISKVLLCSLCAGSGTYGLREESLVVEIPAGATNGQVISTPHKNGKFSVTLQIEPSEYFRRDGADVYTEVAVSLSQAVLGGTTQVRGVYEDHVVDIQPCTSSHDQVLLPAKGLKRLDAQGYGDHHVIIKIQVPKQLTSQQRALMMAFVDLETNTPAYANDSADCKDESNE